MRFSEATGHCWEVGVEYEESREGRRVEVKYVYCLECGFKTYMNYPPPDEWLPILSVTRIPPSCNDHSVFRVMTD